MRAVMALTDRVVVFDQGALLAEGPAAEVMQRPEVMSAYLGTPQQDVREDGARKLQFSNGTCILDAYLYPPSKGKEPVVTYVSTRLSDGKDTDRAACVNSLNRRR